MKISRIIDLHADVEEALDKQLVGFRDGTGKDVEFLLDLNFNFKTEGYIRAALRVAHRHYLHKTQTYRGPRDF